MKRALYYCLFGLRSLVRPVVRFQEVGVMAYHSVSQDSQNTAVSPEAFSAQLALLQAKNYSFVTLAAVVDWMEGEVLLPPRAVALTFDDGYQDFRTTVLPILERYGAPATLFVVGDEEVSRVRLGNSVPLLSATDIDTLRTHPLVTLGYHSRSHPNMAALSGEELVHECTSPFPAAFFAYPGGSYSMHAIDVLRKLGYRGACSIKRTLVSQGGDVYVVPRHVITSDMSPFDVYVRMTQASVWYRALTRCVRPGQYSL